MGIKFNRNEPTLQKAMQILKSKKLRFRADFLLLKKTNKPMLRFNSSEIIPPMTIRFIIYFQQPFSSQPK